MTHLDFEYNVLYQGTDAGMFFDASYAAGIAETSLNYVGFGTFFFDYDNDGRLDLFVANGHIIDNIHLFGSLATYAERNFVFRNEGDGVFREIGLTLGEDMARENVGRGAAPGDFDQDGDQDVLVTRCGEAPLLLRNDGGNAAPAVALRLVGRVSNRDAVGARATARVGDRIMVREVKSGLSYLSQGSLELWFGLGEAESIDSLEIRWPSGRSRPSRTFPRGGTFASRAARRRRPTSARANIWAGWVKSRRPPSTSRPWSRSPLCRAAPSTRRPTFGRSLGFAFAGHVVILLLMIIGPVSEWLGEDTLVPGEVRVRFYETDGEGTGGGGGGGGSGGERPTAYIPLRSFAEARPEPEAPPEPRRAPIAPRKPRRLVFDDLDVPDLPTETRLLYGGVFSPDATDMPGLSLTDGRDFGGLDTKPSSGTGGGIGGGDGTGVGTGEGWGVGPGRGGGFGGGDYSPGAWDIDPVLLFKPPDAEYPMQAKEKMVTGEVILKILVKLDGSTEVVGVVKSLPYCVEAAKENARLWRWKPALKEGKQVESFGIITVNFDLFSQGPTKS